MWIRTQDRETLYNCDYFDVLDNAIYGGRNETNIDLLATYPTHDRALEVLDEIQRAIIGVLIIPHELTYKTPYSENELTVTHEEIKQLPTVYEMPKE